jgi:hypothetical protein
MPPPSEILPRPPVGRLRRGLRRPRKICRSWNLQKGVAHLMRHLVGHFIRHLRALRLLIRARLSRRRLAAALALCAATALGACSSLTPIEKLVIAQDAEPLLAQIRAGEVGVNDLLPWGGAFGVRPSYFTPLCAAAFGGAASALDELLALGADVDVECSPAMTPLDLVMRHPSSQKAMTMSRLLQARGANARSAVDYVIQAQL